MDRGSDRLNNHAAFIGSVADVLRGDYKQSDVARISVEPSDHPVFEKKGDRQLFWWRTSDSTDAIVDASTKPAGPASPRHWPRR